MKARIFILGLFICGFAEPAIGQDLQINATVSRNIINVDEQFQVDVELSGSEANQAPQPQRPDLSEFASYLGSGSSTSMQIINGQMSVSKTFTYHFVATKAGTFTIPPVRLTFEGKNYSSQPLKVRVGKGRSGNASPGSPGQTPDSAAPNDDPEKLFLKAIPNKRRVYQNEPVVVSYKIYTAVSVQNYGISELPNPVGFWSEEFDLPKRPRLHDEMVNGIRYRVAEIKRLALFPQGPGQKTLDPLTIECEVQMPRSRSRRDIFDNFFNDPFFGRTVRKSVRSNPVTIDVKPLPEADKPADFSGAVGSFSISGEIDKTRIKANEAITYKVTISGTGNIKIIPEPDLDLSSDFEVYDPEIIENINRNSDVISGSKTFEYVLIPRFAGDYTIRPTTFSFFDLRSQSYRTVSTEPVDVTVSEGDQGYAGVSAPSSKEVVKLIGQDIRFIQMRMPEFEERGSVFYKSFFFYVVLVVPFFAIAGAFMYRRHQDKLSSNVAYARNRKANQMALKRLKKANKQMREGNPREFYGEVSKALMGFIGDKFNVSAAGLITDEVNEILKQHGVNPDIVTEYISCLQTCDYQRFAPSESDNGEMNAFFEKARTAITNLEKSL